MHYRTLGRTGLKVAEIGLGAYPLSGMQRQPDGKPRGWTGTDDQESLAMIHCCEELGINLIDSAAGYGSGHSETLVGTALKGRRDKWIVATKVKPNRGTEADVRDESAVRKGVSEACEQSLKRLQMDTIDLYQLHGIPHSWAMPAVMETLAQLRQAGKVRWYGISTNDRSAIAQLQALGPIDVLQIGYNLLERSADALLHWAKKENIGTLIRVPLAKGMLSGKYFGREAEILPEGDVRYEDFNRPESIDALKKLPQLAFLQQPGRTMVQAALRFVLDHPGTSRAIAGAKTRQQVEENAAVSELPQLSAEEVFRALPIADQIRMPGYIG